MKLSNFKFRQGTCDANVFHDVVERNEYKLPDKLPKDDLILDVGGHIGSFTKACLNRGARRIIAFEPDPENYCLFRSNLAVEIGKGWVKIIPAAVSGANAQIQYLTHYLKNRREVNTGGASIFTGRGDRPVPNINLDTFLFNELPLQTRIFLKLDCEGAEWEILFSLQRNQITRIQSICGEYHPHPKNENLDYVAMDQILKEADFNETFVKPHGNPKDGLGLFWGKRL